MCPRHAAVDSLARLQRRGSSIPAVCSHRPGQYDRFLGHYAVCSPLLRSKRPIGIYLGDLETMVWPPAL